LALANPGLWHGIDDETGKTVFYLYLNGAGSQLYTPQWSEVTGLKIDGDCIRFRLPYKSYGIGCEGRLNEDKLKGSWKIHHVQYVSKGAWSAVRVFTAEEWDPWAVFEPAEPVTDLVSRLVARRFVSYDAFLSFWDQAIEPDFFALFTSTLYANSKGNYRRNLKDERLLQVYESLQTEEGLLENNKRLCSAVPLVTKKLKEKYPWFNPSVLLVSTLSLGTFDFRSIRIHDKQLLLFAVDWISRELSSEKEIAELVAEGLIYSFHAAVLPLSPSGRTEVVRRGIASFLLEHLRGQEAKTDSIPKLSAADVASLKGRVARDLNLPFNDFFPRYLTGELRPKAYGIFLEFGDFLADGSDPSALFQLGTNDVKNALLRFFEKEKRSSAN
jgi:hypothetical protein